MSVTQLGGECAHTTHIALPSSGIGLLEVPDERGASKQPNKACKGTCPGEGQVAGIFTHPITG